MNGARRPPRVLPITPDTASSMGVEALVRQLHEISGAGAEGVLLREPSLPDKAFLELARAAREIFRGGWVGVHDRAHIAVEICADAVHLGFRSLPPVVAEVCLGSQCAIGQSHHEPEIDDQDMLGDYRLMGPVFATQSKEGLLEPLGLAALSGIPLASDTWAVGGIGPGEVPSVLATGVGGVAAIGSILGSLDVIRGMKDMLRAAEA